VKAPRGLGPSFDEIKDELRQEIIHATSLYANAAAERLGAEIEGLAHHALRGELREKAVDYFRQAGLKAAARSAPDARL
jgi:hypothetical protein